MGPVGETVKQFILKEFLPGEDADQLTESTPLISSGILDSLATLQVVHVPRAGIQHPDGSARAG